LEGRRRQLKETVQMMHEEKERKLQEELESLERLNVHITKITEIFMEYEDTEKNNKQKTVLPYAYGVALVTQEADIRQAVEVCEGCRK
jgi:formylmethanofuran:tetrahydromethanopterin formyltransferase